MGESEAKIRALFKKARAYNSPCIIFIDEIDALVIQKRCN
ncbi:MAG: AAA family ATPase [Candidatus Phytoplasma sp. TWB_XP]